MILLEDIHPALLNALERMIRRDNVMPNAAVRDFDGTEFLIRIVAAQRTAAAAPSTVSGGSAPSSSSPSRGATEADTDATAQHTDVDAEAEAQRDVTIELTLKHNVSRDLLNHFGNFEQTIRALLPPGAQLKFAPATSPQQHTLTLTIPAKSSDATRQGLAERFSRLRAWSYFPVFRRQFELFLGKPEAVQPLRLPYHPGENMYLYCSRGNFICLFAVVIDGKDEQVFAKNFLQTFQDAKKIQKEISSAPGFVFTQQLAPSDLPPSVAGAQPETETTFWCQFQLFRSHMEAKESFQAHLVTQLMNFRNYLLYHIHCCRSYMHALMRKRVESSLLVLNRGKTTTTGRARVVIK